MFGFLFFRFSWFPRCYQQLLQFWARLILWGCHVQCNIKGTWPNIKGPCIILSNHQSSIDPFILWSLKPEAQYICFAAKKELFKIPVLGKLLTWNESICIDRNKARKSYESLLNGFKKARFDRKLVIYPEGTRSTSQKLLPFKRGPFVLARTLKLPFLPIIVKNTSSIMLSGQLVPHKAKVDIHFLDLIPFYKIEYFNENELIQYFEKLYRKYID